MELIKEALKRAKAAGVVDLREERAPTTHTELAPTAPTPLAPAWAPPRVVLDPIHLSEQRIVSYAMTDPSHVAFNLLRTKVYKEMKANGWKSLAVLSPSAGCGKTTVSINLAFSLSRQPNCKTVLIDLDLKKSGIGKALGVKAPGSIGSFLEGKGRVEDSFIQLTDNLIVGLNDAPIKNSSEYLQDESVNNIIDAAVDLLKPDVLLFDLPPMLSSDDAIGFLPLVDCSLMIAAADLSTAAEIDECERQARAAGNYLGLILNKYRGATSEYYQPGY